VLACRANMFVFVSLLFAVIAGKLAIICIMMPSSGPFDVSMAVGIDANVVVGIVWIDGSHDRR